MRAVSRTRVIERRGLLTLALIGAVGLSALSVPWGDDLIHPGGGAAALQVIEALASLDMAPADARVARFLVAELSGETHWGG